MNPLDPHSYVPADSSANQGEISEDDDHATDLINIGLRTADTETRDAVSDLYVDEAYAGEDTEEALDDIARAEADEDSATEIDPETGALHLELPPES